MKGPRLVAVILAGGSGTRFWPLSRKAHPKPLLRAGGRAISARTRSSSSIRNWFHSVMITTASAFSHAS